MSQVRDLLGRYQPRRRVVSIVFDAETQRQLTDARRKLKQAEIGLDGLGDTELAAMRESVSTLEAAATVGTVQFTFEGIGRAELDRLKAKYPPTPEQWEAYRHRAGSNPLYGAPEFNPDALAPALIARCCVDPAMSDEEAGELWDRLTDGDAAVLYQAALAVNMEGSNRPF